MVDDSIMSDHLDWQSDLTVESVFSGSDANSYPQVWGDGVIYLSVLKQQKGRGALIYQTANKSICLTPEPYHCRTCISEYGGKPFWLFGNDLFFANQNDQCLYHQRLSPNAIDQSSTEGSRLASLPKRVSSLVSEPDGNQTQQLMFADVVQASDDYLLSIVECENLDSSHVASENVSYIASIKLNALESNSEVEVRVLEGADFYSNLCIDSQRQRIAWVQWSHPNMPWDETELWIADYIVDESGVSIGAQTRVELEQSASVCQLCFSNNGKLFFSADFAISEQSSAELDASKNYWNIYAVDPNNAQMLVVQVTKDQLEYGYPHWQYGDARIVQWSDDRMLSFGSSPLADQLIQIDQETLIVEIVDLGAANLVYQNLSANGRGQAAAVILSTNGSPTLALSNQGQSQFVPLAIIPSSLSSRIRPNNLADDEISHAQHIDFVTRDGQQAHGFYYSPVNARYLNQDNSSPPPLIVMVHGGPTARAYGYYDVQKQFWTQRGFAILDVNHRGSSGYGRAFRDALYGQWGSIDTSDIVDGISHLIASGKADVNRVCIRGKSAGGYAVLCALTQYPEMFRAGACYYGIGNLVTLAVTTHKFEKHYADRMIGETFHPEAAMLESSAFQKRSPINKIDRLQSAMIVFQGSQDKVVPPTVAHEIIDVLKSLGLSHSYVEYPDEGHGFRQASNNIDAWSKELDFYKSSLKSFKAEI